MFGASIVTLADSAKAYLRRAHERGPEPINLGERFRSANYLISRSKNEQDAARTCSGGLREDDGRESAFSHGPDHGSVT